MKTTKMLYSVSLQSLMSEVKKQEEREKKNVTYPPPHILKPKSTPPPL